MKILINITGISIILSILTGCDQLGIGNHWPYPIKDSGFSASEREQVYWLDESHVLFRGYEGRKPRSYAEARALRWGLFIWDVEANSVKKYTGPAEHLCYHDGYIYYLTKYPGGKLMKGKMGEEKEYPISDYYPPQTERNNRKRNNYSCHIDERPRSMTGRGWIPLLKKDGYLDTGVMHHKWHEKRENYKLIPDDGSAPIELPFSRLCGVRYNAFSDDYTYACMFHSGYNEKFICNDVWDFTSKGISNHQCLPYSETIGNSGSRYVIKTVKGPVVVSHSLTRNGNAGTSGMYLYKNGKYQKLISGITRRHGLSPSGCRVAFYYAKDAWSQNILMPGETTMKMIDLCSKGENKG